MTAYGVAVSFLLKIQSAKGRQFNGWPWKEQDKKKVRPFRGAGNSYSVNLKNFFIFRSGSPVIMKYILTIAASDSCGGAGIQADIKTITALGCHALTAITAVTSQNSRWISGVHDLPAGFVARQIEAVLNDLTPDAIKIGMLSTGRIVRELVAVVSRHGISPVVVDPVTRSSSGTDLLDNEGVRFLREELLPLARVVTPNLMEAGILSGQEVTDLEGMERAARKIKELGPDVVVTGGHLQGECVDLLYDGNAFHCFKGEKIETEDTHGSGCVFSTSLATYLGQGYSPVKAAQQAHNFTRKAINKSYSWGKGAGVVNPGCSRP